MNSNKNISRNLYYLALLFSLVFNGSIFFSTFEHTYDSFVHIFFADHYAKAWFDNWEYRWYTGFIINSYPPLVHQATALLSSVLGLKLAFYAWAVFVQLIFVRGVYHFSKILVDDRSAGIAAILAVMSSSMIEAMHIFGQIPSITGLSFLLNATPEFYKWFRFKKWRYLVMGLSFLSVTTAAHHVTTIFGMVFFILPIIGLATIDNSYQYEGDELKLRFTTFLKKTFNVLPKAILFGIVVILVCIVVVFPYWYWSKTDPINQISIPHGSRDSFILDTNMGLVFFLIPWGILLPFMSYFFKRATERRYTFIGLSLVLLFILGTGGTTPIPKLLLGETAFNILTLDRFTFWGTMITLPFWGLLVNELLSGSYRKFLIEKLGQPVYSVFLFGLATILIGGNILIVNMNTYRPFQPEPIDAEPISRFLERDQHYQWRYLALGFGDQMAWLSANTDALTVDGNYHSARRLPEMTTRAVERLENAKYKGEEGIGALREFLVNSEAFHLKYVFNNDKFYEPILHFSGWKKVSLLENKVSVWEKPDISPLPSILPRKNIPKIQRLMWGIIPLACFFNMIFVFLMLKVFYRSKETEELTIPKLSADENNKINWWFHSFCSLVTFVLFSIFIYYKFYTEQKQITPKKAIVSYYDALDFRNFKEAHGLIDPSQKLDFDQFILEQNIEDGILASYAKLAAVNIQIDSISNEKVIANVTADWSTALGDYKTDHSHQLIKKAGKWYLKYVPKSLDIPPDQFIALPELALHNQGRRLADINKTRQEDILDRPNVEIIEANLVKKDSMYAVVGYIRNIDNVPAYVGINAKIYDTKNELLTQYYANDVLLHNIYPKELSPFRIDLPYFNDTLLKTFRIDLKSLVSIEQQYKHFGLQNLKEKENQIEGEFYNYGAKQISIPQVLIAERNEKGTLAWVEKQYLEAGIRPQRKKDLQLTLTKASNIEVIQKGSSENCVINGYEQKNKPLVKLNDKQYQLFCSAYVYKN